MPLPLLFAYAPYAADDYEHSREALRHERSDAHHAAADGAPPLFLMLSHDIAALRDAAAYVTALLCWLAAMPLLRCRYAMP